MDSALTSGSYFLVNPRAVDYVEACCARFLWLPSSFFWELGPCLRCGSTPLMVRHLPACATCPVCVLYIPRVVPATTHLVFRCSSPDLPNSLSIHSRSLAILLITYSPCLSSHASFLFRFASRRSPLQPYVPPAFRLPVRHL